MKTAVFKKTAMMILSFLLFSLTQASWAAAEHRLQDTEVSIAVSSPKSFHRGLCSYKSLWACTIVLDSLNTGEPGILNIKNTGAATINDIHVQQVIPAPGNPPELVMEFVSVTPMGCALVSPGQTCSMQFFISLMPSSEISPQPIEIIGNSIAIGTFLLGIG